MSSQKYKRPIYKVFEGKSLANREIYWKHIFSVFIRVWTVVLHSNRELYWVWFFKRWSGAGLGVVGFLGDFEREKPFVTDLEGRF